MTGIEREVLKAAVAWSVARDRWADIDDEIGDTPGHELMGEQRRAERALDRAEKKLLFAARELGGIAGSMSNVGRKSK